MAEYIEREALIKRLQENFNNRCKADSLCKYVIDKITTFPVAEVEPVVHGRWIWNENACTWDCSNCNGSVGAGSRISKYAHCPFCGARMDGGADNG